MFLPEQERFMRLALEEARKAALIGEIPIGAVVVCRDKVIARAHNLTERLRDVTAHAEMQAITAAMDSVGGKYLESCTLYVTVEPCPMCASALNWAQIGEIIFGTEDPKRGYLYWEQLNERSKVESIEQMDGLRGMKYRKNGMLHPKTKVQKGLLADECRQLIQDFFKTKR
jgi:tRNA(adenine34) deaminase